MTTEQWIKYVSECATDEVLETMGSKLFGPASICEAIVRTVITMENTRWMRDD